MNCSGNLIHGFRILGLIFKFLDIWGTSFLILLTFGIFIQFLVVGTHWGMIHIFDHAGNAIRDKEIAAVSTDISYRLVIP